jgi:hypothetical protein
MPRPGLSSVITAPGTEVPFLSVTVPRREVVPFCPQIATLASIKTIEASMKYRLMADHPMGRSFRITAMLDIENLTDRQARTAAK